MLTSAQMYWFTRLDRFDSLGAVIITLGAVCLFGFTMLCIMFFMHKTCGGEDIFTPKDVPEPLLKTRRTVGTAAAVFLTFGIAIKVFVPTTKEMAAIYVIPKVVNNEKLCDAGDRLYDLAVEWMEALRPGKTQNEEPRIQN